MRIWKVSSTIRYERQAAYYRDLEEDDEPEGNDDEIEDEEEIAKKEELVLAGEEVKELEAEREQLKRFRMDPQDLSRMFPERFPYDSTVSVDHTIKSVSKIDMINPQHIVSSYVELILLSSHTSQQNQNHCIQVILQN
jgi:hypothetical protein